MQEHEIEKLHISDGWVKITQEVLPHASSSDSSFLILVGWSMMSIYHVLDRFLVSN